MFEDTQPAALDDMGDHDTWAAFRVPNADARLALLRELRDGNVPLSVSSPCGALLRTAIWSLDTAQRRLNLSADERHPQLQQLVQCDEAVAVAYLESVKLQFDLARLVLVRGTRTCTLQADMPSDIYRFQRRRAYRVRTPQRQSPVARLRHPAMPEMLLVLRLVDISVGGCALWLADDMPPLQVGTVLGEVQVEFDADTRFSSSLRLQHVSAIDPGAHGARLGCEWVGLGGVAERVLQRWVDQAQKRHRLISLT